MKSINLTEIHNHSKNNKTEILSSRIYGCFYCKKIFKPNEIQNWLSDDKDQTALCAFCQIDSVIGDAGGFEITETFLDQINKKLF